MSRRATDPQQHVDFLHEVGFIVAGGSPEHDDLVLLPDIGPSEKKTGSALPSGGSVSTIAYSPRRGEAVVAAKMDDTVFACVMCMHAATSYGNRIARVLSQDRFLKDDPASAAVKGR
jgi:hypothetical protein